MKHLQYFSSVYMYQYKLKIVSSELDDNIDQDPLIYLRPQKGTVICMLQNINEREEFMQET